MPFKHVKSVLQGIRPTGPVAAESSAVPASLLTGAIWRRLQVWGGDWMGQTDKKHEETDGLYEWEWRYACQGDNK